MFFRPRQIFNDFSAEMASLDAGIFDGGLARRRPLGFMEGFVTLASIEDLFRLAVG